MTFLTKKDIIKWLNKPNMSERIIISPYLDHRQIGSAGIDLRLACDLIVPQKIKTRYFDALSDQEEIDLQIREYTNRIKLDYGESFTLHPGEFIIGNTFEYISLPKNIIAFLHGRSTWGRLGLIVHATAGVIQSNFQGVLTFELTNLGSIPIQLYPLMRIAQLVFFRTTEKDFGESSPSQYSKHVICELPNFKNDYDVEKLKRIKEIRKKIQDYKIGNFNKEK
ncbi:MAG: dCTP deaminase [Promethearchaeota archaeon]